MTRFLQIFHRYIFPLLSPLVAAILVIIQQVYYPSTNPAILINILLLAMNLIEFVPLLLDRSANRVLHLIGIGFVAILAFQFNIVVGGVSTPLSDFKSFLDSMCGLWTAILAVELFCLYLQYIGFDYGMSQDQSSLSANTGVASSEVGAEHESSGNTDGTSPEDSAEHESANNPYIANMDTRQTPVSGQSRNIPQKVASAKANIYLFLYALAAFSLPFTNGGLFKESGWMDSVRAIDELIYGNNTYSDSAALLLYLLSLFVIFIAGVVGITIVKYALARYFSGSSSREDFFEQYSTPIIILAVGGALVLSIRANISDNSGPVAGDGGEGAFPDALVMLSYVTSLFGYMLCIIVVIIALLVAFETIRLVLKQCTSKGTLLKGSMQLIFVLIVQYAMGLLMGILRIFALRDVIESLLLFFLPDLDQSVEPEVKQVLRTGLKREVRRVASDMQITQTNWGHQRQRRSRCRVLRKRRRK